MDQKIGNKSMRPKLSHTILSIFAVVAFVSAMYSMEAMQDGSGLLDAFGSTWGSRQFWQGMVLPLVIFIIAFPWVMYWGMEALKGLARRSGRPGMSWKTIRGLTLGAGAFYLVQVIAVVWMGYRKTGSMSETLSKSSLMLVFAGVVLFFDIHALMRPSKEKAKAMETGDYTKVHDERHRQVTAKAAESTVWICMGLFFVFGSAADMLIYHQPPVRAWLETFAILVVCQLAYDLWNKRI